MVPRLARAGGSERPRRLASCPREPAVEPKVFRCSAVSDHQRVVIFIPHVGETGVQREIVPRLPCMGLITLEIVDRRLDFLAGLFARAYGVNNMPNYLSA
jgi:hypothetical protein